MGILWIENMRRRDRVARAQRLGLQSREDLLRRPDEVAASGEASAVGHDAVSGSACPSAGEPERADASPDAEETA